MVVRAQMVEHRWLDLSGWKGSPRANLFITMRPQSLVHTMNTILVEVEVAEERPCPGLE